jgi:hypothetical protein
MKFIKRLFIGLEYTRKWRALSYLSDCEYVTISGVSTPRNKDATVVIVLMAEKRCLREWKLRQRKSCSDYMAVCIYSNCAIILINVEKAFPSNIFNIAGNC